MSQASSSTNDGARVHLKDDLAGDNASVVDVLGVAVAAAWAWSTSGGQGEYSSCPRVDAQEEGLSKGGHYHR